MAEAVTNCFLIRNPRGCALVHQVCATSRCRTPAFRSRSKSSTRRRDSGRGTAGGRRRRCAQIPAALLGATLRSRWALPSKTRCCPGPRAATTDGVWAKDWYEAGRDSTGFRPYRAKVRRTCRRTCRIVSSANACRTTSGCTRSRCMVEGQPMLQTYDERNRDLIVNINGKLVHRDEARRQPVRFGGAGGRRRLGGAAALRRPHLQADEHLDRLRSSALALAFAEIPSHDAIIEEIRRDARRQPDARRRAHPADADARREDHLRHGPAAEPVGADADRAGRAQAAGLRQGGHHARSPAACGGFRPTASTRRSITTICIQSILAKIEANVAGADDALMLDMRGFVAETNATHVFIVERRQGAHEPRGRLPRRHHPRGRAGAVPRATASRATKRTFADRGLSGRRNVLHGHDGRARRRHPVDGRTIGNGDRAR